MAIQTRTVLKTYFNTGDKPTETQFVDLIDSSLNLTDGGTLTGVLSSSLVSSDYSLIAHSASFNHVKVKGSISASNVHIDADTLFIGGTSFSKSNLDDLKAGRSIAATETVEGISLKKSFKNSADSTTFIRMSDSGKAWHYVGNKPILKLAYAADVGIINVGENIGAGFVSLDSATKLSAGAGNPNIIETTFTIPNNMNYQLIGPEVSVSSSISVGEGSLLYITQP